MKRSIFILISNIIFGCNSDKANSKIEQTNSNQNESIPDSTRKLDSLGYPSYYTHPEIRDISKLEDKLRKSNKVLAYNFNGNNGNIANVECYDLYDSSEICSSAINKRKLEPKQIEKLINITCDSLTYDGNWSGLAGVCFIPHLGFGFFKNDSLIAQVNICFICDGIRTRPYYKSDGLTKNGEFKFIELAKDLDLKVVDGSEKMNY